MIAGELKDEVEKIMKSKKDQVTQFDGYIVSTDNNKVLISAVDKDKLFPDLKSMQIYEKITVNYPGGLTLAFLLAQKIFGEAETTIKNG